MEEFIRTESLIGSEGMKKLKNKKVAIFGIGGVGGYTAEALARCGIFNIDLFDNDTISVTNINRQIIATRSTIGKYKVDVMKERLLDINPSINVNAYKVFYMPENSEEYDLSKYDYVVDAIDTVTAKIELICKAKSVNTPIISSMGTGNKLEPTKLEVADISKTSVCPLARVMRRELKDRKITSLKVVYSKEESKKPSEKQEQIKNGTRIAPSSICFVPSVAGLIIASEVVKDLLRD